MCSSRNCLFKFLLLGKYEYFLELHYAKVCRTNQCCKSQAKEGNGKDTHLTKKQTLSWIPYLLNFTLFSLNRSSQIQNLLIHVRVMRKCYVHMYTVFVANENIISWKGVTLMWKILTVFSHPAIFSLFSLDSVVNFWQLSFISFTNISTFCFSFCNDKKLTVFQCYDHFLRWEYMYM